jgi:hypothetical protein
MSPRRAKFTEVEVRRALKAAKAEGFDRVELTPTPDGLKIVATRLKEEDEPVVTGRLD